jgi:hypothetical protein
LLLALLVYSGNPVILSNLSDRLENGDDGLFVIGKKTDHPLAQSVILLLKGGHRLAQSSFFAKKVAIRWTMAVFLPKKRASPGGWLLLRAKSPSAPGDDVFKVQKREHIRLSSRF